MKRSHFITSTAALSLMAHKVFAELPEHKIWGRGNLETGLLIFNLYQQQPAELNALLEMAFPVLGKTKHQTFATLMQQPPFMKRCQAAGLTHLGGPMLGQISETGAAVWVRTLKPASVTVKANGKTFGPVRSTTASDLTAIVQIEGLKPHTETPYRVFIDGQPIQTQSDTVIRTVTDKPAVTRIGFGSCWHRWGLGHPMMDTVRQRKPAAMLMIGDVAVQDRRGNTGKARHDVLMRDFFPTWRRFCAEIPIYTSWDDHDYAGNDLGGVVEGKFSDDDRTQVRNLYTQTWVNAQYGQDDKGIYQKVRIGPADVFLTDNRSQRDHSADQYPFFGKKQMDWLKKELLESTAPFKILSCGTMWSDYVSNGKDSWGRHDKKGREELFRFIEENKIGGILLISGDRHGARGFTIPRPSGFTFYEFGAASYGGRIGPPAQDPAWTHQLYGIAAEYAFSEFEFDTTQADPTVTLRVTHESGREVYATTLTRSQLTPS